MCVAISNASCQERRQGGDVEWQSKFCMRNKRQPVLTFAQLPLEEMCRLKLCMKSRVKLCMKSPETIAANFHPTVSGGDARSGTEPGGTDVLPPQGEGGSDGSSCGEK